MWISIPDSGSGVVLKAVPWCIVTAVMLGSEVKTTNVSAVTTALAILAATLAASNLTTTAADTIVASASATAAVDAAFGFCYCWTLCISWSCVGLSCKITCWHSSDLH